MKILIVEDEAEMLSALKRGFIKKGYTVDTACDGITASYLAETNVYDVIVLDLNLPKKDGLEVLEEIRSRNENQKVIILSARSSVSDKVLGLDTGANDYMSKPFDFLELEARIRSLARREYAQKDTTLSVQGIVINTKNKKITVNETVINLPPKEYAILEYLVKNCGKVVSSEELIDHVWKSDVDLFSVSVKVHISNIRKKLIKLCGKEVIKTVRGFGYMIETE